MTVNFEEFDQRLFFTGAGPLRYAAAASRSPSPGWRRAVRTNRKPPSTRACTEWDRSALYPYAPAPLFPTDTCYAPDMLDRGGRIALFCLDRTEDRTDAMPPMFTPAPTSPKGCDCVTVGDAVVMGDLESRWIFCDFAGYAHPGPKTPPDRGTSRLAPRLHGPRREISPYLSAQQCWAMAWIPRTPPIWQWLLCRNVCNGHERRHGNSPRPRGLGRWKKPRKGMAKFHSAAKAVKRNGTANANSSNCHSEGI